MLAPDGDPHVIDAHKMMIPRMNQLMTVLTNSTVLSYPLIYVHVAVLSCQKATRVVLG
jgi:hypothetical protein